MLRIFKAFYHRSLFKCQAFSGRSFGRRNVKCGKFVSGVKWLASGNLANLNIAVRFKHAFLT
jgi:hypothetical protein